MQAQLRISVNTTEAFGQIVCIDATSQPEQGRTSHFAQVLEVVAKRLHGIPDEGELVDEVVLLDQIGSR